MNDMDSPSTSEGPTNAPSSDVTSSKSNDASSKLSYGHTQGRSASDATHVSPTLEASNAPSDAPPNPILTPQSNAVPNPDPEEESGKEEVTRSVGNPGNFSGERLAYMEEHLAHVFPGFSGTIPPCRLRPLENYTEKEWEALSARKKKSYKKRQKYRQRTEEERYKDMVKAWFRWRSGQNSRKGSRRGINKVLSQFKGSQPPPRKHQLAQFVMTHPKYRQEVIDISAETGRRDMLSCCRDAAKVVIAKMNPAERQDMEDQVDAEHTQALETWENSKVAAAEEDGEVDENEDANEKREQAILEAQLSAQDGFGTTMQELLDHLREKTGFSFLLLGGQSLDGKDSFRAITIQSSPEGNRGLQHFDFNMFRDFGKVFHKWLREIYFRKHGVLSADVRELIGRDIADTAIPLPTSAEEEPVPTQSVERKKRGQTSLKLSKGKKKSKSAKEPLCGTSDEDEGENGFVQGKDNDSYGESGADGASGEVDEEAGDDIVMDGPAKSSAEKTDDSVQENIKRDEEGILYDHDTPEYQNMSYMEQAHMNRRLNRYMMKQMFGTLEATLSGEKGKGKGVKKWPSPKAEVAENRTSTEATRKSSRLRKEVNYQEPNIDDDSIVPTAAVTTKPLKAQLLDARAMFFNDTTDTFGVKEFVDLIEKITAMDSRARMEWTAHVSALSDATREMDPLNPTPWPEPPTVDVDVANPSGTNVDEDAEIVLARVEESRPSSPVAISLRNSPHVTSSPSPVATPTGSLDVSLPPPSTSPASITPSLQATPQPPSPQPLSSPPTDGESEIPLQPPSPQLLSSPPIIGELEVPPIRFKFALEGIKDKTLRRHAEILLVTHHTPEWESLVFLWIQVESAWAKIGITGGTVSTNGRPEGFPEFTWVGRNRPGGLNTPSEASLENLRTVWPSWWRQGQPAWRLQEDGKIVGREGDWTDLQLPALRGFVMFLIGLRWWFDLEAHSAASEEELNGNLQRESWNDALKSVYNTLAALLDDAGGEQPLSILQEVLQDLGVSNEAEEMLSQTLKRHAIDEIAADTAKKRVKRS